MAAFTFLPIPTDRIPIVEYGNEDFIEIHLDERFNIGENIQLCKVWQKKGDNGEMIIEKSYKIFHDANQCIDFITSYQWRKVFLTLTDHFSYLLELIHDLPQIVYFYIYSISPKLVPYHIEQYPKLQAVVQENSPDADKQLLEDIDLFRRDLMPMNVVKPIKRKTKLLIQEAFNIQSFGYKTSIVEQPLIHHLYQILSNQLKHLSTSINVLIRSNHLLIPKFSLFHHIRIII